MSHPPNEVVRLSDGDIVVWVEQGDGSVMLKAITRHGDPVELNAEQLKELCEVLMCLARSIE